MATTKNTIDEIRLRVNRILKVNCEHQTTILVANKGVFPLKMKNRELRTRMGTES